MTRENETPKCNPEDVICQFQILANLRGLQSALGNETFKSSFPELEGLTDKITERIAEQDISLKEALGRCGLAPTEEVETETTIEEEEGA